MPKHVIRITETINAPREKVFAYFADHEKFASLLGGKAKRIKEGDTEPNGLGSVRECGPKAISFDETIVKFDRPKTIHYAISRGGPLKNHKGEIEFKTVGKGTQVNYTIAFDGKFPLIGGLIKFVLEKAWSANGPRKLAKLS